MGSSGKSQRRSLAAALVALVFCVVLCVILNAQLQHERRKIVALEEESAERLAAATKWEAAYNELSKKTEAEREVRAVSLAMLLDQPEEEPWIDAGEFRITHYCPCKKCCGKWAGGITASGVTAAEGRTVAVDPKVIPLGSEVMIDGAVYIAEDTGVSGKAVDVFLDDHRRCIEAGLYYADVKWRPQNTQGE